jgi:hypothetical protein
VADNGIDYSLGNTSRTGDVIQAVIVFAGERLALVVPVRRDHRGAGRRLAECGRAAEPSAAGEGRRIRIGGAVLQ